MSSLSSVLFGCCLLFILASCATTSKGDGQGLPERGSPAWNAQYRIGVRAAHSDLRRGITAWEANDNGEWETWRVLWCFRKLLGEKYGIEYRLRGHLGPGDNTARISGYQSVADPHLRSQFGDDWAERFWAEADAFYREHWPDVKRQFFIDEGEQPGYEEYTRRHPISDEERRARNPMDKFYDYRDKRVAP